MKTIALAAHKGGVGKTTLTALLAHKFILMKKSVYLLDLDPQGSLADWWGQRDANDPLQLISSKIDEISKVQSALINKADILLIDTPPAHQDIITAGIDAADFVLVPCRPSPLDIRAIGETIAILNAKKKPFAFALNLSIARTKISEQALMLLSQHGKIAPSAIRSRTIYASAMNDGGTALDYVNKDVAVEIDELYKYLINQMEGL